MSYVRNDWPRAWGDGEPGDCFLTCGEDGDWAIWKILDGADLELARELGYAYDKVAAMILTGDRLNFPASPKTDELDPPYGMCDAAHARFSATAFVYLGKL